MHQWLNVTLIVGVGLVVIGVVVTLLAGLAKSNTAPPPAIDRSGVDRSGIDDVWGSGRSSGGAWL